MTIRKLDVPSPLAEAQIKGLRLSITYMQQTGAQTPLLTH